MNQPKLLLVALAIGTAALAWAGAAPETIAWAEEPPVGAPPVAPAPAPGKAAPVKRKLPIEKAELDWYGVYMDGNKVGYARISYEPIQRAGKTLLRSHYRVHLSMKALGSTKDMAIEQEILYASTPPYAAVEAWNVQKQGAFAQRVELRGKPGAFKARITAGGQSRELKLDEDPVTFLEEIRPYVWFREARKVGEKVTYRSFDLADLNHDDETLTVTKVEKTVVDGVPLTYYVAEQRSKKDGSSGTMRVSGKGKLLSVQMMGGSMEVRLEPEAVAKQPGKPVDIFVSRMARIDKPLGKQSDIVEMVVEVRGPGIEHIKDGPRQRASYDAEAKVLTLRLGAAHDPKVQATAEELRECLAEDAGHPTREPAIVKLAQRAIGDAKTDRVKVKRLVAFVDKFIEDSYSAEPLSVLDIVKVRKGDCTEHSALFTTLARAVGVPARQVGGLMYVGDELRIAGAYGFGGHAWNEVVLDGIWVPVDATWGQVEIDATHIRQNAEDRDRDASAALSGARIKLISIKRK